MDNFVFAAGGVIFRTDPDLEVVVVHRPNYNDWSFPKGKRDNFESDEECAKREVWEETGLTCKIVGEIGTTNYVDRSGRDKTVRYFAMVVTGDSASAHITAEAVGEIDEIKWVNVSEAFDILTYQRDKEILEAFVKNLNSFVA